MRHYRKILLIADAAMRVTPAYHRAERLARVTGAELHLCVFDHSSAVKAISVVSSKVADVLERDMIEQRKIWLRGRAEHLRASGIEVRTHVGWGTPIHDQVIEHIKAVSPDLVVKDVHLEPLLKRVLFTPLDRQLLRLCPAPLLLVRGGSRKLPRRVIAAVDTAHPEQGADALNEQIVQAARELAAQCSAKLHLVHTFEDLMPVAPGEVMSAEAFNEIFTELRQIHRRRFEAFADEHDMAADRRHFIYGPSAYALPEFASHSHTDVLVLGTTHRTGIDQFMIGSTAEKILEDLRCDVLAVKPEGFGRSVAVERKPTARTRATPHSVPEPLRVG